jgi:hypothetical protein
MTERKKAEDRIMAGKMTLEADPVDDVCVT